MKTKYYYNGKLLRTTVVDSNSHWEYGIYNEIENEVTSYSPSYDKLANQISERINNINNIINKYNGFLARKVDEENNPVDNETLSTYEKIIERYKELLEVAKKDKVVKLEKRISK